MIVVRAKTMGFCPGVQKAFEKAFLTADKAEKEGKKCYLYGQFVHNQVATDSLLEKGILLGKDILKEEPGYLITRVHGIPEKEKRSFEEKGFIPVDCVCPVVKKNAERLKGAEGKKIIIGQKSHAETLYLSSFFENIPLISSPEDLSFLEKGSYEAALQTTFSDEMTSLILEKAEGKGLKIHLLNSVCNASVLRRSCLTELSEKVDALVVVGDENSANSRELFHLAESLKPSFFVSSSRNIPYNELKGYRILGLTAGASVPAVIYDEIEKKLENL